MGDAIDKLLGQISAYEILNNVIPGAVYAAVIDRITSFSIFTGRFWIDLVISYFLGLIIGRLGSIVGSEHAKKKIKAEFEPYESFIKAEKKDNRIREMASISNMYRSFISVALCVFITYAFSFLWGVISDYQWARIVLVVVGCLLIAFIFQKAYHKQSGFVSKRVKAANQEGEQQP